VKSKSIVEIYTDGSCKPNPGKGGWAAILIHGDHEKIITGAKKDATNNQMELTAAVKALLALKEPCNVQFHTDSEYLRKGITEWMPSWKAKNWKRKTGKLANVELWQSLDKATQTHQIDWKWVKAHNGHTLNERVDQLAFNAMQKG
jgi:ribonuclease HI